MNWSFPVILEVDIEDDYEAYREECEQNGITPKDIKTWWNELE